MKPQVQFKINPKISKINQAKLSLFSLEDEVSSESLAQQAEVLMNKGIAHAESGEFKQALTCWVNAASLDPSQYKYHEMQAQVYLELNEPQKAAKAAERCLVINPEYTEAYITLARAHINAGELELAYGTLQRGQSLDRSGNTELQEELQRVESLIREKQTRFDSNIGIAQHEIVESMDVI